MVKHSFVAIGICYVACPLMLLIVENIVPLMASLIALIVIGVLLRIGLAFAASGEGSDSGSHAEPKVSAPVVKEPAKPEVQPKVCNINRDAMLCVEETMIGTKVIRAYADYTNGKYMNPIDLCAIGDVTLHEFQCHKVIIKVNGRTMGMGDLHYISR